MMESILSAMGWAKKVGDAPVAGQQAVYGSMRRSIVDQAGETGVADSGQAEADRADHLVQALVAASWHRWDPYCHLPQRSRD